MYDRCRERPRFPRINRRHHLASGLVFAGLGGGASTLKYVDSSLWGTHGTLTNMTPATDWVWDGTLNRFALDFDGSNDSVNMGTGGIYPSTMSFAAWIWSSSTSSTYRCIAGRYTGTTATSVWRLELDNPNTKMLFSVIIGDSAKTADVVGIATDTWFHFCGVHDGSVVTTYVNGIEQGSANAASGAIDTDPCAFVLGARSTGSTNWKGKLSDPLLYSRALSPAEISMLADPSNVMLSGLILPPRRRLWAVSGGAPAVTRRNLIIGGGVA